MFKVRIDRDGWESFTGQLGTVEFKDGVSVRPLTEREVQFLGASIRIVRADTDEQVGVGVTVKEGRKHSAKVVEPLKTETEEQKEAPVLKYDRDKLDEIASEGGIKAIREVANEFGVKGVQISSMIEDILKAQTEGTE